MKKSKQALASIAVLLTAFIFGAVGPCEEVAKPCLEVELPPIELPEPIQDFVDSITGCPEGKVCNGALPFYEECANSFLPDVLCDKIQFLIDMFGEEYPFLYEIGTCQYPGETGFPCAEDDDCASGVCSEGFCFGPV